MTAASPDAAARRAAALSRAHPLTMFGFDALISGAARLRPERIAARDALDGGAVDHAELDRRVDAFRAELRDYDLEPGERVLLAATPNVRTLTALIGLIAAGLEPVLAPLGLPPQALAAGARSASAAALIGPASFGGDSLEELLLGVAATAPSIRLIGSLGPGTIDGAVDFGALDRALPPVPAWDIAAERPAPARKVTIGALDCFGAPRFYEQSALLGRSLSLVAEARVSGAAPLVSLCSPGTIGGLVAGPLASLLSGAPLHFVSPFDADGFLAHLDAIGPARLVAPRAILADLDAAGLLTSGALLGCVAIARTEEAEDGFAARAACCPIVEIAADGAARPAAREWARVS
ncbi:AMP-binding protein [Methylosinus sp. Sm6]|uniref:AMP-binding protein n=1 Tax=Methylosinus sp. Sm6 TaxID=2866948 RepID=UPI00351CC468